MAHTDPVISVIIVNYRVPHYLRQAIRSIADAEGFDQTEIIVVDNASNDDSQLTLTAEFPHVQWIALKNNVGFSRACNAGARIARGTYLLFLNPDTLIARNSLTECVDFIEKHPAAGLIGPKTLNPNGSLQAGCRRSFPTPMVSLYRLSGLSRIFPKSKRFGQYNLTYLDPDIAAPVDAVSGSFMFLPRELFRQIDGFDESFFMYGEDLDLCARVKEAGREVWYNPATQIVHFKGKSTSRRSPKIIGAFYRAMILFSRKYRHTHGTFFPTWLIYAGIFLQAGISLGTSLLSTFKALLIDVFIINSVLWLTLTLRFMYSGLQTPYTPGSMSSTLIMHVIMTVCFIGVLAYRRSYSRAGYTIGNFIGGGISAALLSLVCMYFLPDLAYSRIAFALSSIITVVLLIAWREAIPRGKTVLRRMIYSTGKVVIVGNSEVTAKLIENVEKDPTATITGVVWPFIGPTPAQFKGYPVLGSISELPKIIQRERPDVLLLATAAPWYSYIIQALSQSHLRHCTIRWVAHELFDQAREKIPATIPLQDFTV